MRLIVLTLASVVSLLGQPPDQSDDCKTLIHRGHLLSRAGQYRESLAVFEKAVRIASAPGSPPQALAYALNGLAMSYDEIGESIRAEPLYRRALALIENVHGQKGADYAAVLANLGGSYMYKGQLSKAESLMREAIAIHLQAPVPDPINLALARNCLAKLLLMRGALEEAEPLLNLAVSTFESIPDAQAELAMAINNRAALLSHRRRYDESAASFERSLSLLEDFLGNDNPLLAQILVNLGTVYCLAGHYDKARARLDRARSIAEERLGPEHPVYGTVLESYAALFKKTGHKADAKKAHAQAKAILENNARRNGSAMSVDISALLAR